MLTARQVQRRRVTWTGSTTTSDPVECDGHLPAALELPTGFAGDAITILAAVGDDDTFRAVIDDAGNAVSWVVAANRVVMLPEAEVRGLTRFKLVSDETETNAVAWLTCLS